MDLFSLNITKIDIDGMHSKNFPRVYIEAVLEYDTKKCIVKYASDMISFAPAETCGKVIKLPVAVENQIKNIMSAYVAGMQTRSVLTMNVISDGCTSSDCELEE